MLLDLCESLACPRCGPPQGVIVLVERMELGRVLDGRLDCPNCETRFPLRDGIVEFGPPSALEATPEPPRPTGDPDDAVTAAALLGIRHGRGLIVVGPGLGAAAAQISSLCGGCEVLRLEPRALPPVDSRVEEQGTGLEQGTVTPLLGVPHGMIPVLGTKAIGVAVEGGGRPLLSEAVRVLVPGGRMVVIRPVPETEALLSELRVELLAADPRAIVARRN